MISVLQNNTSPQTIEQLNTDINTADSAISCIVLLIFRQGIVDKRVIFISLS